MHVSTGTRQEKALKLLYSTGESLCHSTNIFEGVFLAIHRQECFLQVNAGCDTNKRDDDGCTGRQILQMQGHDQMVATLESALAARLASDAWAATINEEQVETINVD